MNTLDNSFIGEIWKNKNMTKDYAEIAEVSMNPKDNLLWVIKSEDKMAREVSKEKIICDGCGEECRDQQTVTTVDINIGYTLNGKWKYDFCYSCTDKLDGLIKSMLYKQKGKNEKD